MASDEQPIATGAAAKSPSQLAAIARHEAKKAKAGNGGNRIPSAPRPQRSFTTCADTLNVGVNNYRCVMRRRTADSRRVRYSMTTRTNVTGRPCSAALL